MVLARVRSGSLPWPLFPITVGLAHIWPYLPYMGVQNDAPPFSTRAPFLPPPRSTRPPSTPPARQLATLNAFYGRASCPVAGPPFGPEGSQPRSGAHDPTLDRADLANSPGVTDIPERKATLYGTDLANSLGVTAVPRAALWPRGLAASLGRARTHPRPQRSRQLARCNDRPRCTSPPSEAPDSPSRSV